MFDFIKSNKLILSLIFLGFFLIVLIFGVMLFAGREEVVVEEEGNPFGEIDETRVFSSNQDVFGPGEYMAGTTSEEVSFGQPVEDFRAVTKVPVIGAVVFDRFIEDSTTPVIRFTSISDGHIYETPLMVKGLEDKLSDFNTFLIGEVEWSQGGTATVVRYLDSTERITTTYLGRFTRGNITENTLEHSSEKPDFTFRHLDENIRDLSFSPDGTKVFYLVESEKGLIGYIESIETGTKAEVWTSMLTDVSVNWGSNSTVLLYTNPSSVAKGAVWSINSKTYSTKVLLADEYALSAKINEQGTKLLYSVIEKNGNIFSLRILDLETDTVTVLPFETVAEKCIWGKGDSEYIYCAVPKQPKSGDFLEDWYMGIAHTDDTVFRINTNSGNAIFLLDPKEKTKLDFDIVNLQLSPNEDYLLFISQKNNALWSLKLPEKQVISSSEEM